LTKDADMQTKWRYFLKTIRGRELPFSDVINGIERFLYPVWTAIIDEDELLLQWYSDQKKWGRI
jgi:2-hydroxy-3-keto-5-methylthiopentenyl-1-phosphate phosphatase